MIDKHSEQKAYIQVKDDIKHKIIHNIYKVGDKLPTNMQLCELFNVSRITINRALSELEAEGYIEKFQGKGCYVKFKEINQNMSNFYSFTNELKKMNKRPSSIFLSLKLLKPDVEVMEKLNITSDDRVFLLKRLRLADGVPVCYDRSYIPEKYIPSFKKEMIKNDSLYETMEEYYGFSPNNSEETIEAIILKDKDAEKLKLEYGSPALLVKRVSYFNEKPIEYNYRIVNSKVFKYKMSLK